MRHKKTSEIYYFLFKNIIIYFIIGSILISIITFLDKYSYVKKYYEINIVLEWINNIIIYILPIFLGIFIASKVNRPLIKLKRLKLLWIFLNCFFNFIIFRFIAMFILIINFIIFPLPS